MPYKELKTLYEYHSQPWEKIKEAVLRSAELDEKKIKNKEILVYLKKLSELFVIEGDENKFSFLPFEKAVVNLLDLDLLDEFLSGRGIIASDLEARLYHQLFHISAAIGLISPPPITYEAEEITELFSAKREQYNFARFIRTLAEGINNEDNKELLRALLDKVAISFTSGHVSYTWDEALIFTLLCHLAYNRFANLSEETQSVILSNYFHRAIVVGAPVQQSLSDALYKTNTAVAFALKNRFFVDAVDKSLEKISPEKSLPEILKDYSLWAGNDKFNEKKQFEFAENFYKANQNALLISRLKEILSIYWHLCNGDLIKSNQGHELFPDELYFNDLVNLIVWFDTIEEGSVEIIKYFAQEKPRVPLSSFVEELKKFLDFKKEKSVQICLMFTEALHQNNLLPAEKELIAFHEADGQFHWTIE